MTFDRVIWTSQSAGSRHVWVANADGSEERQLSSFHYEGSASWFPNAGN